MFDIFFTVMALYQKSLYSVPLNTCHKIIQLQWPTIWEYERVQEFKIFLITVAISDIDRLCGLAVRVLGYRSGDPGSIPGTTRKTK
jgi:hypothetical protein